MKIIYQGKEYTIKELKEEQMLFSKSLEGSEYLQDHGDAEWFCDDPGYMLALTFFKDVYSQISSARFSLLMGHKKLHDSNYVNWKSGEIGQYWLRYHYLRNSIIWYNSSFDLLWQVLWFGFYLFRKIELKDNNKKVKFFHDIDSKETYEILLKGCNFNNLKKSIILINSVDSNELLDKLTAFHSSAEQKTVRIWANKLKHHGSFHIKELYFPGIGLKTKTFDSEFIMPLVVGIDEIPEVLKQYHISFRELSRYIYDFCQFEKMIPEKEEDRIPFIKDVKEYKRIIV